MLSRPAHADSDPGQFGYGLPAVLFSATMFPSLPGEIQIAVPFACHALVRNHAPGPIPKVRPAPKSRRS